MTIDLLLAFVALAVFAADLVLPQERKSWLGPLAAAGVAGVLAATFRFDETASLFGGAYVVDGFALYLKRIFLAAGVLGILLAIPHGARAYARRQGEYLVLLLLGLLGMSILCSARELMLLAVAFELMGLPLYVLAAIEKGKGKGAEAAIKLYLVGAASAAVTLYGLSLVYGAAGTTMLDGIAAAAAKPTPLFLTGMMLVLAGIGFKVGAVPFHMWVPDTYEGAPTPFVGFLSVAPKAAGFAVLVRLYLEAFGSLQGVWKPIAVGVCVATLLLGSLLAIPQRNVKRLLAYSGIAQVGYMLIALVAASAQGVGMLLFFLAAYVFANLGAFGIVSLVGRHGGTDDLDVLKGLARRSPPMALAMLLFLLSLGGIPFVAGFWAKLGIFLAAYEKGLIALVLLGALLAVVGVFFYLRVARAIYFDDPPAEAAAIPVAIPERLALGLAVIGVVGMGVFPRPFVEAALDAAKALLPAL